MAESKEDKEYNFSFFVKIWTPMTVAVVTCIFTAQAWMAQQYFSMTSAEALERRVSVVESTMLHVTEQNDEIIAKLNFVMGKLSIEER